jgi:hypothetical protein
MVAQVAVGELGEPEADPPERLEQDVGEGREPEPELVGAHGGGRGATGEPVAWPPGRGTGPQPRSGGQAAP